MAHNDLDYLNNLPQPTPADDDELKKSNLYQSSQRLRVENISSQSDTHGGGGNILTKESAPPVESVVAQLPESVQVKSETIVANSAIPVSNPTLPETLKDRAQAAVERGIVQAADTHLPGKTTHGADEKLAEIVVHQNQFQQESRPALSPPPQPKEEAHTQVKVEQIDTYESPKINILGQSTISAEEDTSFGLSFSYTTSAKGGMDSDSITVIIRGLPDEFIVTKLDANNNLIVLTRQADGSYAVDIDDLPYISVHPPENYSGDVTFQAYITGVTADGVTLVSSSLAVTVTVVAVADTPTATVHNLTGTEDSTTAVGFDTSFSATSDDAIGTGIYGSEVITAVLKGVPANVKLYYEGSSGEYLSKDSQGNWIVDPAKLSLVRFDFPENYKGKFTVTLLVTSTEPSDGDSKSVAETFTVTIYPVADGIGGYIAQSLSGNENTAISSSSSNHAVEIIITDPSETLHVTLDSLPSGVTVTLLDGTVYHSTGTGNIDITSWGHIIVENGVTKWVIDQLSATSVTNSDADFTLHISAYTTDSGAGQTVTSATTTIDIPVTVLAVAQPAEVYTLSGAVSHADGSWSYHLTEDLGASKTLAFHVGLTDTDGSEILTAVLNDIPTGTTIIQVDQSGHVLATNNGTDTSLTLVATSDGNVYLKIIPPANSSDDFVLNLVVQTQETNADDSQVAVRYNDTVIPIDVVVSAKADLPDVHVAVNNGDYTSDFAVTIKEHIESQTYTPVTFSFTANSTDFVDSKDPNAGPETITSITITGLPSGTVITSDYIEGGSYTVTTAGDVITLTIPAGQTAISGTYSITPPTNYEGTIAAVLSVTSTEPTNGDSITNVITQTINIDPIATTPSITLTQSTYAITEDPNLAHTTPYTISFNTLDSTTDDLQITLSGFEPGTIIQSTTYPIVKLTVDAYGNVTLTSTNWPDLHTASGNLVDLGTVSFYVTPPENYSSSSIETITVTATAIDGTDRASTSGSFDYIVSPVADPLNNPTASATNVDPAHDASTLTINLPLSDTDGSESITSALLQGIPDGYTIKVLDHYNNWVDVTLTSMENGYNKIDLASYINNNQVIVQVYPPNGTTGTIHLELVATNTDVGIDANGDPTSSTNLTNIPIQFDVVQAYSTPTTTSGNEDTNIPINLGITVGDGIHVSSLVITNDATDLKGTIYLDADGTGTTLTLVAYDTDLVTAGWTSASKLYYVPNQNDSTNANLTIDYKVSDSNGNQYDTDFTNTINVIVAPVADDLDSPSITAANVGHNDTYSSVTISLPLTDTDGSESISSAILTGIPNGYTIKALDHYGNWGDVTLTSTGNGYNEVDLEQYLDSNNQILVRAYPPEGAGGTINLELVAINTDTGVDANGDPTDSTNSTTLSFSFIVAPVADPLNSPTITATDVTPDSNSYSTITISLPLTDMDGSESITSAILTGIPNGYTIKVWDGNSWVEVTLTSTEDGYNKVDLAQYLDNNNQVTVQAYPPDDAGGTVNLHLIATNTDTGVGVDGNPATDTNQTTLDFSFIVAQTQASAQTTTGNEDTNIPLDLGITVGSNTSISSLIIHDNATTSSGKIYLDVDGTGTTLTEVAYDTDLVLEGWTSASKLYYTPNENDNTNANLTIDYQISSSTYTSDTLHNTIGVTVLGQADTPTITANNFLYTANTTTDLGIQFSSPDTDGSEHYSFILTVTGSGDDWTLLGGNGLTLNTSSTDNGVTTNTYTIDSVATLESLQFNSGSTTGEFTFSLETTVTENDYNATTNTGGQATFTESFTAQATWSVAPTTVSGLEDNDIPLNLGITILDPNIFVSYLVLNDEATTPSGKIYIDNHNGNGEVLVTDGNLLGAGWTSSSTVYYRPDANNNTDTTIEVKYEISDSGGHTSGTLYNSIGVTVLGQADEPGISTTIASYEASTTTNLGIQFSSPDTDGSEHYSFILTVTGSDGDWKLLGGNDLTLNTSSTDNGVTTNTYTIDSVATLESLQFNSGSTTGEFTFSLETTVKEDDYNVTANPDGLATFEYQFTITDAANSQSGLGARMAMTSSETTSENILLDINDNITTISDSDLVTISGFSSNTNFYSVDTSGHQTLVGQTDANGSIILTGSQVNGLNDQELYYDNLNGHNTFDMVVQVNDHLYSFNVDQNTGQMTATSSDFATTSLMSDTTTYDMTTDTHHTDTSTETSTTPLTDTGYTDTPTIIDQTSTTLDQHHHY